DSYTGWVNSVDRSSVAISSDGKYVLMGGLEDHTSRLWEVATGKEIRRFKDPATAHSVAFSPDGKNVLTGSSDGTSRLWETATGKEIRRFEGHSSFVDAVAFSGDGQYVLAGSGDKTARLWQTETGKEIRRFEGHSDTV